MSVGTEPVVKLPNVQLIEPDGEPLETYWHVLQIGLLLELLACWFRGRDDYFAGGNMFLYYSEEQARSRDYRGPDFFFVDGVNRLPMRPYWAVWQEGGRYPDLIIELLSPTTAKEDRTTKKTLYERTFKTHEYICYDPSSQLLEGWRLGARRRYKPMKPDARGWMWIEELELWLGPWEGVYRGYQMTWLRFYDRDGRLVPTGEEAAATEVAALKSKLAKLEKGKRTS
jgi:Uma2 family endonuclease